MGRCSGRWLLGVASISSATRAAQWQSSHCSVAHGSKKRKKVTARGCCSTPAHPAVAVSFSRRASAPAGIHGATRGAACVAKGCRDRGQLASARTPNYLALVTGGRVSSSSSVRAFSRALDALSSATALNIPSLASSNWDCLACRVAFCKFCAVAEAASAITVFNSSCAVRLRRAAVSLR